MADVIIIAALAMAVFFIVRGQIRRRGQCPGGCAGCGGGSGCPGGGRK